MNKKAVLGLALLLIVAAVLLAGCAPGVHRFAGEEPDTAGFFWGIWHGWIAPVSLVWSVFNSSVSIYEAQNTGFGYDFGFYIAVIGGFGGISFTRKKIADKS